MFAHMLDSSIRPGMEYMIRPTTPTTINGHRLMVLRDSEARTPEEYVANSSSSLPASLYFQLQQSSAASVSL